MNSCQENRSSRRRRAAWEQESAERRKAEEKERKEAEKAAAREAERQAKEAEREAERQAKEAEREAERRAKEEAREASVRRRRKQRNGRLRNVPENVLYPVWPGRLPVPSAARWAMRSARVSEAASESVWAAISAPASAEEFWEHCLGDRQDGKSN